jgi:hypothetical protein
MFDDYEQADWHVRDVDWKNLDRARATPSAIRLARAAVMGECNSVAALHGFLNESEDDYDFAAYASLWAQQELRHHFVFRRWLDELGERTDDARVAATRRPYPLGVTFASTLTTNVISELTVCHLYAALADVVEEPVLRSILRLTSRDEARHAREFMYFTGRRLQDHPDERQSVLETLYVYVGDASKVIKHPVSVFKSGLPALEGHETIDDAFALFLEKGGDGLERLRHKIINSVGQLVGVPLENLSSVRRAIARMMSQAEARRRAEAGEPC